MFSNDGSLSLATVLGPILGRIVYAGVATNDLVTVIRNVEQKPLTNASALAVSWMAEWSAFANKYRALAENAKSAGNNKTAETLYYLSAVSFRAGSLINSGSIEAKAEIHQKCAKVYRQFVDTGSKRIVPASVPFRKTAMNAYLHLPEGKGPFPAAVMFGGVGGCKEELHGLGTAHAARGIAVLAVDLPGLGESLLLQHLPWRLENLVEAISESLVFLKSQPEINAEMVGVYGLCLGGAMAFKYSALKRDAAFCTSMFPMILSREVIDHSPSWAKMSDWFAFFCGNASNEVFEAEMMMTDDLSIECPYLLVQGRYDNWTPLERAAKLFEQATAKKDMMVVDEPPVYESGHMTTHSVPVVDQYHWAIPVAADRLRALLS